MWEANRPDLQISTEGIAPGKTFAYWADEVSGSLFNAEAYLTDSEGFRARLLRYGLGPATLTFVENDPHESLSRRGRGGMAGETFDLWYLRRGAFEMSQSGRTATVRAGECVLLNTPEPTRNLSGKISAIWIRMPAVWLRRWLDAPEEATVRTISGQNGWGAALTAMLAALSPVTAENLVLPPGAVAEQIASLMTLAAGAAPEPMRTSQQALLRRLRQSLRDHLQEPDYDPSALAAEHRVSLRTVHAAFAGGGGSFGRDLMALRLNRAREHLDDRRFDGKTMAEIAALVGFSHPSHFASRFRQAYGVTPAAYRAAKKA